MPLVDDILDVLRGANLFSTMDIASGYWNVSMVEDSIKNTAFTCKYGLFEWLVMPFGCCNAVPAFERLMENVWSGVLALCIVLAKNDDTSAHRNLEMVRTRGHNAPCTCPI
jgi:hypothetical protein